MTGIWDGSGISWTMCKQSAPRSRQITAPTAHHSIFTGRMLSPNQQCQSTEGTDINTPHHTSTTSCCHLANNWFCYLFFLSRCIQLYADVTGSLQHVFWRQSVCLSASVSPELHSQAVFNFFFFLRPWVSRYQLDLGINEARNLAQNRPLCRLISLHSATHS